MFNDQQIVLDTANAIPTNKVVVRKTETKIVSGQLQGVRGPRGFPGIEALADFVDVSFENLGDGDTMTYDSTLQKWVNTPEEDLVDGGNF